MKKISIIVRLGVAVAVTAFLFWRCRYGIANIDECFNLSLAYRLWQGDALLVDMWDLQQLFGVVMLPVVWIYMKIMGTTDGFLLNLRYLFEILMIVVAIFHYIRWRSYDERGAFWGAVAFSLTCPFSLNNFTYNSVGAMLFSVVITLYATNVKRQMLDYVLCGFFYSVSVLCCPFLSLAALFFMYRCWRSNSFVKEGLPFVSGCSVVGIAFLTLILARSSMNDILSAIPCFWGDNAHANRSLLIIIRDWGGHFLLVYNAWSLGVFVLAGLLFIYQRWFDKKSAAHFRVYRMAYLLIGFILLGEAILLRPWPDFIVLSSSVIALLSLNLIRNLQLLAIIWTGVLPAFIYGFCICAGSNQGSFVISSVFASSIVPACVVFSQVYSAVGRRLALVFFLTQAIGLAYARCQIVFWDSSMNCLSTVIANGPQRGIVTTEKNADMNEKILALTRQCFKDGDGILVYFQLKNLWQCFITNNRIGAYSLWATDMKNEDAPECEYMARMDKYYEMHPMKFPDIVSLNADSKRAIEYFKKKYKFREVAKNEYIVLLKR